MASRPTTVVGVALMVLVAGGIGVVLATPGASVPANAQAGNQPDEATIQVSASAEVSAPPDVAKVHLAVVATADTAEAARGQVAENASSMRSALREVGVSDDQVRTTYYDIAAVHEETDDGAEVVGYRAVHAVEVTVTVDDGDLGARTGTVVDTAVGNGSDRVDGVEFTLSEKTRQELREEALGLAMENARADATVLASSSDLTITGVQSISTADVSVGPYDVARAESADDTVLEPGPVTVSATVSVTYEAE